MGSVIPDGKLDKIQFCEAHIPPFTTNAVAIGTTSTAVTDLATKTTAARAAYDAQQAARLAAKNATLNFKIAVRAMGGAVSDIVKQIKAKAGISGDGVYALASIPVPAARGPVPPLAMPTGFAVELTAVGALEISWKCTQPPGATGATYQVYRRIGAAGEFVFVGGTGTKKFVDETVPAGSASVTYQVRAIRSTSVGPWAQFNVNFGVSSGGAMNASVVEVAPAKIAA